MNVSIRAAFAFAFGLTSGLAFGVLAVLVGDELIRDHRAEKSA